MHDEYIAKGGFGCVYKRKENDIIYAVKRIEIVDTNYENVQNEVHILQKVHKHANIVSLVHVETNNHFCDIIMEFYEEDLLNYVVNQECLTHKDALHHFVEMQKAVQYLHLEKICHRDIKLENFLKKKERVVLTDFGLSKIVEDNAIDKISGRVGSLSYCAPEVLAGITYNGFKSDLWSMGVCLVAMICGFFPFKEASTKDWRFCTFIEHEDIGIKSIFRYYDTSVCIPTKLYELIHKMISTSPHGRSDATEILCGALELKEINILII